MVPGTILIPTLLSGKLIYECKTNRAIEVFLQFQGNFMWL